MASVLTLAATLSWFVDMPDALFFKLCAKVLLNYRVRKFICIF